MSRMRDLRVEFDHLCADCQQPVVFELGEYAPEFGRIYSTEGLKTFHLEGTCEFCQDYLADARTMNRFTDYMKGL